MKKNILALFLLSASAFAQNISPSQIKPSSSNGQVLTTVNGVTSWAPAAAATLPPNIAFGGTNASGTFQASPYTPVNKAGDTMTGTLTVPGLNNSGGYTQSGTSANTFTGSVTAPNLTIGSGLNALPITPGTSAPSRRGITFGADPAGDLTLWFSSVQNNPGVFIRDTKDSTPYEAFTPTGSLLASGAGNASGVLNSQQGAYVMWNLLGGTGETDFVNQRGGGPGGFNWYNATGSGSIGSPIMSLDPSGALTATGALTVPGLSNSGGYTQSGTSANTFTGAVTVPALTATSISNSGGYTQSGTAANTFTGSVTVPSLTSTGSVVGQTGIGPSSSVQWTTGSSAPSGSCTNGALYTNQGGGQNTAIYVCIGNAWYSVPTMVPPTSTANGYYAQIGGLIMQWGETGQFDTGPVTVTFPIAFSDTTYQVEVTNDKLGCGDGNDRIWSAADQGKTTTSIQIYNSGTGCGHWFAIGH